MNDWIKEIKKNFLLVIDKSHLINGKIKLNNKGNKETLYSLMCHRACLNPKSKDVRQAFEELYSE